MVSVIGVILVLCLGIIAIIFTIKYAIAQFKLVASDSLRSNTDLFFKVAEGKFEQYSKPIQDSLQKVDAQINNIEKQRVGSYESLREQVRAMAEAQVQLKNETINLSRALRAPSVRGRWGEIQLKRVVEMAGLLDHCDFFEQATVQTEQGARLRPDLIIKLPGNKTIVVDAKAPLSAYLEAHEATDETVRVQKLKQHSQHIRNHLVELGRKNYWDQFSPSPEFVILFLPGEVFFSAALEQDPGLIEAGIDQQVILATPTTLIALLRSVAYGWRQESIAENAQKVAELGRELSKRLWDMTDHFSKVGRHLAMAVEAYNKTLGSFESRVLVSARKFDELKVAPDSQSSPPVEFIENQPRLPQEH